MNGSTTYYNRTFSKGTLRFLQTFLCLLLETVKNRALLRPAVALVKNQNKPNNTIWHKLLIITAPIIYIKTKHSAHRCRQWITKKCSMNVFIFQNHSWEWRPECCINANFCVKSFYLDTKTYMLHFDFNIWCIYHLPNFSFHITLIVVDKMWPRLRRICEWCIEATMVTI
jgi:hypothetical protein